MPKQQRYSEKEVFEILRAEVAKAGTQSAFARAKGVSRPYLSDVLSGRRDIGPAIYRALGFERVVEYVRVR